ncbi:hypothetical protein BH10PSE19_BH10PSE19_02040 [soil metagenome]
MNNYIKKIVLFTSLAISSNLGFANTTTDNATSPKTPAKPTYTKTLLIFDLNSNKRPSFSKFLQGKNVALIAHNDVVKNKSKDVMQSEALLTKVFKEYILANKNALKQVDQDNDGIINNNDPHFEQLAVLHLEKSKEKGLQQVVEPIYKYGIRKIILNGKYISLSPEKRKKNEQYVAGVLILRDGSSREILDIVTGQQ